MLSATNCRSREPTGIDTVQLFDGSFVKLHLQEDLIGHGIKAVKAQLRNVPRKGIGYGTYTYPGRPPDGKKKPSQVRFNYLGQFGSELDNKLFTFLHAPTGSDVDFHFESLHQNIKPLFFILDPKDLNRVYVRVEAGEQGAALRNLQSFYEKYNPGFVFNYKFLDQDYQALYASEKRVSELSQYFAGLTILISCLGLFGLASFTAQRRLKEIGIRKVHGASQFAIVRLLTADFTKMVITAIFIALPISYFLTRNWLNNFNYKIPLEWWYFVSAGLAALLIGWLTVGITTVKASQVRPITSLKDE